MSPLSASPPSPRLALAALAAVLVASSVVDTAYALRDAATPAAFSLMETLAITVCVYAWYRLDAAQRGFRRTVLQGAAIVIAAVLAVPVYLVRSRPPGARLRALGGYAGLLLAAAAVTVAIPALVFAVAR